MMPGEGACHVMLDLPVSGACSVLPMVCALTPSMCCPPTWQAAVQQCLLHSSCAQACQAMVSCIAASHASVMLGA